MERGCCARSARVRNLPADYLGFLAAGRNMNNCAQLAPFTRVRRRRRNNTNGMIRMRGFESVGRSVGGGLAEAAGQAPACARGDTIFASDKGPAYFAEAAAREISFRRAAGRCSSTANGQRRKRRRPLFGAPRRLKDKRSKAKIALWRAKYAPRSGAGRD